MKDNKHRTICSIKHKNKETSSTCHTHSVHIEIAMLRGEKTIDGYFLYFKKSYYIFMQIKTKLNLTSFIFILLLSFKNAQSP